MSKIPKITPKEFLVLHLLVNLGPELYGLQLVRESGGRLPKGGIYTVLQRMTEKGVVESRQEYETPEEIGIPRRLYKPSALGERTYTVFSEVFDMPDGLGGYAGA